VVKILEAARVLAEQLAADISLSATREEHIRVTARANAALEIYNMLSKAASENG
jgi:hypothetical protein